jgi:hypothetical protein
MAFSPTQTPATPLQAESRDNEPRAMPNGAGFLRVPSALQGENVGGLPDPWQW